MKILLWIVLLPLFLLGALFAVSNRGSVAIGLWPFFDGVEMPLFVALVGALYIGFLLGAIIAWWSAAGTRARARAERRRADALARDYASLQTRIESLSRPVSGAAASTPAIAPPSGPGAPRSSA